MPHPFRVAFYSDASPREIVQLLSRIHKEVSSAVLCGLICRPSLETDALLSGAGRTFLSAFGHFLLRLLHACPRHPNGEMEFRLADLMQWCQQRAIPLQVISGTSWDSPETVEFCQKVNPDLAIVQGSELQAGRLLDLPNQGSIRALSRRRTGGAGAGFELTIDRVDSRCGRVLRYATPFAVEPFDTPSSLRLKRDLLATDLILRCVKDIAGGATLETQPGTPPSSRDELLSELQKDARSTRYYIRRGRPTWKLLLRTVLFFPYVLGRNWLRRLQGRFPVIILYHHLVSDRPHRMGIPTAHFQEQVDFLRRHYRIVSLAEAVGMLRSGRVEAPTVVLTFDDGYADNFVNLRAVTEAAGIPAVLFVCTDPITGQAEFVHDVNKGERGFPALSWDQVRRLHKAGFEIGSHTRTHFDCGSRDANLLVSEIVGSRQDLEKELGCPIPFFSFPWGNPANMSAPAMQLARGTYAHVLSACGGENVPSRTAELWHLLRRCHTNDLWELELALQGALELERGNQMGQADENFA